MGGAEFVQRSALMCACERGCGPAEEARPRVLRAGRLIVCVRARVRVRPVEEARPRELRAFVCLSQSFAVLVSSHK